jgi:HSP20 family protein
MAHGQDKDRSRSRERSDRSQREIEPRESRGEVTQGRQARSVFSLRPYEMLSASPFELIRRFSDEMNRAFEGFGMGSGSGMGAGIFSPSVEIQQRDDEIVACVDLPGLEPDDVKLDITEDGIVLRGERKREARDEGEGWTRSEVSYGQFMRVIPLPPGADTENASAQFDKGVLRIRVPISESRGRRSIPIEAGERGERGERRERGGRGERGETGERGGLEREDRPGRSRGQPEDESTFPPAS